MGKGGQENIREHDGLLLKGDLGWMAIVSERKIVINDRTYLLLRRITRGGPHKYTRKTATKENT